MSRTVALVVKTLGGFIDPFTGLPLQCITDGQNLDLIIGKYKELRTSGAIAGKKKGEEVKIVSVEMIGSNTSDGVFKAKKRFA